MNASDNPWPHKGPADVHRDAMRVKALSGKGSCWDSTQAPGAVWGHRRVTPVASYRQGLVSQTGPQSLVLAPTRTCGDTDKARVRQGQSPKVPGKGGQSHGFRMS